MKSAAAIKSSPAARRAATDSGARGSAWEINVKMNVPGAVVVSFDNSLQAVQALRKGEIDAVSTDEVILARLLSKLPDGEYEIAWGFAADLDHAPPKVRIIGK